ncbi:hypothetical protein [Streptomyces sp. NPDC093223]|uniref:hypothetical protein n=1 Tax=Streptomyces sp. NPDC093223 TaxID=3366033 RepID=UPI00380CDE39
MSTNRLIKAGNSRLQKAADSGVDPAVPPELQQGEAQAFTGARVISPEDISGSAEEQLAYVTKRLYEIDHLGRQAEDFVVLNKGVLLEVAQERELHTAAGHTNFSVWAGAVLDIEPKYVFEVMKDAARIREISAALESGWSDHLTRASARKVMADVIADQGPEAANVVLSEGVARAAAQGKRRPTAALLAAVARDLAAPVIPAQEVRSEISDLTGQKPGSEISDLPAKSPVLVALERAVRDVHERVYVPLAPASVRAALAENAVVVVEQLADLEEEIERVTKRLAAARRAVDAHASATADD